MDMMNTTVWNWGWRDGPVVKTMYCSARGPKVPFQHPHWAATTSSKGISGHLRLAAHSHTQTDTHTHNLKKNSKELSKNKKKMLFFPQINRPQTKSFWPSWHLCGP